MKTIVYMVRHGDSPKTGVSERTRELSEKGRQDAAQVSQILLDERVEIFASSPYARAVQTIIGAAEVSGQEVFKFEDLKEKRFCAEVHPLADHDLIPLLERSFSDSSYSPSGGESNAVCQKRAVRVFKRLLKDYAGKKIAIGSHGAVMTLIMGHFDPRFNLEFLLQTTKPDIYRMEFQNGLLVSAERIWKPISI
ncbi:histidine phosphatase family protein [Peribacillus sp. SCS-26]|uniref:histidine phosphatase family protein n=1 Tax=Paraperibacillus marinus TaxID=3115295 RepID=UPI003906C9EC